MRCLGAILILTIAATAQARKPGALPPMEISVGAGAPVGGSVEAVGPSTEITFGLSWASLAWNPTRFDVGLGGVLSYRDLKPGSSFRSEAALENTLDIGGAYLSLGTTLARDRYWRAWITTRGELLAVRTPRLETNAVGASLRITAELYKSLYNTKGSGAVIGTFALGVYAEATYRDLPDGLAPLGITTGITCRVPFIAGS